MLPSSYLIEVWLNKLNSSIYLNSLTSHIVRFRLGQVRDIVGNISRSLYTFHGNHLRVLF